MLTIFLCAALAAAGCGSDDSSDATGSAGTTTESSEAGTATTEKDSDDAGEGTDAGGPTKPNVQPPSGPPPKELVIEDIDEGSGPEAEKGDKVTVHFVADDDTGKEAFSTWPGDNPGEPLAFKLGAGKYPSAFEEGIEGMRVGGRRELGVPKKDAQYTESPLFYVIDLIAVE
jgi:peptidylprolyl isomerase